MDDSLYAQVQQLVGNVINGIVESDATAIVHPGAVARAAYQAALDDESLVPLPVEWTSVEQFKQIARKLLRGKFDHDSNDNDVYQGDMFSGHLQDFYPVKSADGESFYKRRELLTDSEIDQNLSGLKKQADARLVHYDALLAYKMHRNAAAQA